DTVRTGRALVTGVTLVALRADHRTGVDRVRVRQGQDQFTGAVDRRTRDGHTVGARVTLIALLATDRTHVRPTVLVLGTVSSRLVHVQVAVIPYVPDVPLRAGCQKLFDPSSLRPELGTD